MLPGPATSVLSYLACDMTVHSALVLLPTLHGPVFLGQGCVCLPGYKAHGDSEAAPT